MYNEISERPTHSAHLASPSLDGNQIFSLLTINNLKKHFTEERHTSTFWDLLSGLTTNVSNCKVGQARQQLKIMIALERHLLEMIIMYHMRQIKCIKNQFCTLYQHWYVNLPVNSDSNMYFIVHTANVQPYCRTSL